MRRPVPTPGARLTDLNPVGPSSLSDTEAGAPLAAVEVAPIISGQSSTCDGSSGEEPPPSSAHETRPNETASRTRSVWFRTRLHGARLRAERGPVVRRACGRVRLRQYAESSQGREDDGTPVPVRRVVNGRDLGGNGSSGVVDGEHHASRREDVARLERGKYEMAVMK